MQHWKVKTVFKEKLHPLTNTAESIRNEMKYIRQPVSSIHFEINCVVRVNLETKSIRYLCFLKNS